MAKTEEDGGPEVAEETREEASTEAAEETKPEAKEATGERVLAEAAEETKPEAREGDATGESRDLQPLGDGRFETTTAPACSFLNSVQAIAAEANNYSKNALESSSSLIQKLFGVRSFEGVIQIQSEFAKTSYAGFVSHAMKMSELYSNLANQAFKPIEAAIAKGRRWKE
ncbi:phasin family protein [Methylocapsa polymorpha]|uniref:Phasin family protein n=1 Tax=Methylocapsa polymorpha TaxID=3080828 RepID=A0ABZ0HTS0_9HYPH|nr:phasin family protein [Methylocapsa sp. RX1]